MESAAVYSEVANLRMFNDRFEIQKSGDKGAQPPRSQVKSLQGYKGAAPLSPDF